MYDKELKILLEFGGGAELLFDNIKSRTVCLDSSKTWKIKDFLIWIKENILTGKSELFLQDDSVRPGILVLINDADWELMGELEYELQPNDNILFISTLHGG